jgi:hypothetical protein
MRRKAAEALGRIGTPASSALQALRLMAWSDPHNALRGVAAEALLRIIPVEEMPEEERGTLQGFHLAGRLQHSALAALGRPALPAIVAGLHDSHEFGRTSALHAINGMAVQNKEIAREVVPDLLYLLRKDPSFDLRGRAARALLAILDTELEARERGFLEAYEAASRGDWKKVAAVGEPAVLVLRDVITGADIPHRIKAAEVAAAIGPAAGMLVPYFLIWSRFPDAKTAETGTLQAEVLKRAGLTAQTAQVKEAGRMALEKMGYPVAEAAPAEVLKQGPDVVNVAIFGLSDASYAVFLEASRQPNANFIYLLRTDLTFIEQGSKQIAAAKAGFMIRDGLPVFVSFPEPLILHGAADYL